MKKMLSILALVMLIGANIVMAQGGKTEAVSQICVILESIQWMLYMIAGGIGVVVITLQGIKWAGSAEDPGARKQAKQGIIHAVIGLVIVLLAVWIVTMVFSGGKCNISQPT
jgi:hypothetical protein